jgi:hypothetical protein
MLKDIVIIAMALGFVAHAAFAQDYKIYASQSACQTRTQTQCQALKCDGVQTVYWWPCVGPLQPGTVGPNAVTNSSYALEITNAPFGATTNNLVSNGTVGLNATEVNSLEPASAMANVLPNANTANQAVAAPF